MKASVKIIVILLVFLFGYMLGNVGLDFILNKMKRELVDLNLITLISFISSLTTILVFIVYIIGKLFAIKKTEFTLHETIQVSYEGNIEGYRVVDEFNLGENTTETVCFVSSEPMRKIKFYEYDYENDKNGKLVQEYGVLKNGEALKIKTYLPCGIHNYIIEYERFDYVQGKVILGENGYNGLLSNNLSIEHTWKSYFYYLVKA
ncbi:hypothetical protein CN680_07540 [Bacillus pseudomycoides]|uniref:hypothetical protein n=1 Tax=Bacillus pseudomycoides TaxID=64104 RepID=UPI000BEC98A8|nr:hypothetical protein [Bacillus pseudomycoides]PED71316.1 hypothetical protein CON97_14780 [Bacillus pseudomycoides]PEI40593.1 hypothetical protein CN620_15150 [Bacillus pseudomycoides]PEJ79983.1 hypothetical protein CN680_07540 [Bacillus pseudomycoides]PEM13172.1 hypothetical protein CN628_19380 [Bacillus pseudomycoides]PEO98751.1 hypothetical protein CN550_14370 [Bacillus pseudomycoides]